MSAFWLYLKVIGAAFCISALLFYTIVTYLVIALSRSLDEPKGSQSADPKRSRSDRAAGQ